MQGKKLARPFFSGEIYMRVCVRVCVPCANAPERGLKRKRTEATIGLSTTMMMKRAFIIAVVVWACVLFTLVDAAGCFYE